MESDSSTNMIEFPFALEWEISEERLNALKDSTKNEWLESDKITVVHASNFQYFLRIYPNGKDDESRGEIGIFLEMRLGKEKNVEAEWTFSIKSANWEDKNDDIFCDPYEYGYIWFTVDEFFDATEKYIVDGKLILKVEGIFKIENTELRKKSQPFQLKRKKNFCDLWNMGYNDFTIIAGGKEIEVHKIVIASYSTVFDAMFSNTKFKEGKDNKVKIIDFPFEIVEKAIQLCYHRKNVSDFSIEENAMLLKFTDKYDIAMIKENIEANLSQKLTVSNLCEMVKLAEEGNSPNLRNRCLDFFIICLLNKKFIPNMKLFDSEFLATAIENSLCYKSKTL